MICGVSARKSSGSTAATTTWRPSSSVTVATCTAATCSTPSTPRTASAAAGSVAPCTRMRGTPTVTGSNAGCTSPAAGTVGWAGGATSCTGAGSSGIAPCVADAGTSSVAAPSGDGAGRCRGGLRGVVRDQRHRRHRASHQGRNGQKARGHGERSARRGAGRFARHVGRRSDLAREVGDDARAGELCEAGGGQDDLQAAAAATDHDARLLHDALVEEDR